MKPATRRAVATGLLLAAHVLGILPPARDPPRPEAIDAEWRVL